MVLGGKIWNLTFERTGPGHTACCDISSPNTAALDLWETTYLPVLQGEDPVVEWIKGRILGPLLDGVEVQAFLDAYRGPIGEAYPGRGDGKTVLQFKRLFLVATR